jgi:hypothetical protein
LFYSVLSLTSFSSPKISKNDQINSIGPETYYHIGNGDIRTLRH